MEPARAAQAVIARYQNRSSSLSSPPCGSADVEIFAPSDRLVPSFVIDDEGKVLLRKKRGGWATDEGSLMEGEL